jgi:Tol biopolymer transport system component
VHRAVPNGPPVAAPATRSDRPASPAPEAAGAANRRLVWVAVAVGAVVVVGAVVAAVLVGGNVGGTAAPSTGSAGTPTDQSSSSAVTYGPSPTPVVVTSSGPVAGLPHATPLGTQVVVVPQVVDGTGDLYAVDADSAETVARLTSGAGGPQAPVVSPDRGSVVYVQSSAISGTVRTVAVDGSGDRALWDGRPADCQTFFRPAWNPVDQTRLAVPCVTTQGSYVLSVIGVDQTVHATIDTGLASVTDVSYSPDGTTLTYRGTGGVGDTTSAIYRQPADGSAAPTRLTDGTAADGGPMFSPDGERIVFTRSTPGASGSTIMLMNADGSDLQPLTDGAAHDQDPAWSPDGTRIVFSSDRSTGDPNVTQFWVMQGNGADPQPLNSEVANGPAAWGHR